MINKTLSLNEIYLNEDIRLNMLVEDFKEVLKKSLVMKEELRLNIQVLDLFIEDMIPNEKVVITISHLGYVKRTPLSEYRQQNRGGGSRGASSRDLRLF